MRLGRRWIWKAPNGIYKDEIDFILTNDKRLCTNIKFLNHFELSTDHRMITTNLIIQVNNHRPNKINNGKNKCGKKVINIEDFTEKIAAQTLKIKFNFKELQIQQMYDELEKIIKKSKEEACHSQIIKNE